MSVERVEENSVELVFEVAGVGDPLGVGRPGDVAVAGVEASANGGVDFDGPAVVDIDVPEVEVFVGASRRRTDRGQGR